MIKQAKTWWAALLSVAYIGHFLLRQHPIPNWNGASEVTDLECSTKTASLCRVFQIGHIWGFVFDHLQKLRQMQANNSSFFTFTLFLLQRRWKARGKCLSSIHWRCCVEETHADTSCLPQRHTEPGLFSSGWAPQLGAWLEIWLIFSKIWFPPRQLKQS